MLEPELDPVPTAVQIGDVGAVPSAAPCCKPRDDGSSEVHPLSRSKFSQSQELLFYSLSNSARRGL
jgi:hypothetical protein